MCTVFARVPEPAGGLGVERVEVVMAWVERSGKSSWRVRYREGSYTSSISGFHSEKAADVYACDLETDRRRGSWLDPAGAAMPLVEWAARWVELLDVEPRTEENYRRCLRLHIVPRWGSSGLGAITASEVALWLKRLRRDYAASTVNTMRTVLSMMLDDAVDDKLIATNPVRRRRRGRRRDRAKPVAERVWAMPEHVVRIAEQATMLGGPSAGLLVITAAWTGCRWGELAGLQRHNVDLDHGAMIIDADTGALHESVHRQWLGPPKTPASARSIQLPPFLTALLREHLAGKPGTFVFTSVQGRPLWRSTFDRRVFRPAVDGDPRRGLRAVRPRLTLHGLRHSHKTWMIADGIPEIAQARRLGHHLANRLAEVYSHVAPEIETKLLRGLERRWKHAVASNRPPNNRPSRRGRGRDPHTAPTLRTTPRRHRAPRNRQVTPPGDRFTRPNSRETAAPELLLAGAHRDQHRPWLPIIAATTIALRPAQTPERRIYVEGWS